MTKNTMAIVKKADIVKNLQKYHNIKNILGGLVNYATSQISSFF